MKPPQISSRQLRRAAAHAALVTVAVASVTMAGCTRPKLPIKPKPKNPIINEHMLNVERGAAGMARSMDDGDMNTVADTAKYMASQLLQTRAIPLAPRDSGEPINMSAYTQELDKSIRITERLRRALYSNRWDLVAERYNDLRLSCISCHNAYVDRTIELKMPSPRNF